MMKLTTFLKQALRSCAERFPVPVGFATALAAYSIIVIFAGNLPDRLTAVIFYGLSVGFVLALTLALWSEERPWTRKVQNVHIFSYTVLAGDTLYLYFTEFGEKGNGFETFLMHVSAILALVLTVFFLSFIRERDDIPAWNFALRLALNAVVCVVVGGVLWLGLCLLLISLKWLFGVTVDWEWYATAGVLFAAYLPVLLFLSRIPGDGQKHDSEPLRSSFLAGVFRYLFLPLEALYIFVLYVYAIRILLSWQLPDGQVSWLVIASVIGLIAIEYGLYPTRHAENRPFDNTVARLLPLIVMPLLLLMTIGIVRRFSDYGITIARLYLATLNAWCYAVCLYLFLNRARRIHWIPISFAVLFLLTSALPINYTSITRHVLLQQVKSELQQTGATSFPVNAKDYAALLKPVPAEKAARISSKLQYLEKTFNSKTIEPLVTQKDSCIYFQEYIDAADTTACKEKTTIFSNYAYFTRIRIPEGYTELHANVGCNNVHPDLKQDIVAVPVGNDNVSDTLLVSISMLKTLDKKMDDIVPIPTQSGHNRFLLQSYTLNIVSASEPRAETNDSTSLRLDGYLFTK